MKALALIAVLLLAGCGKASDPADALPKFHGYQQASAEHWQGVEELICTPARQDVCGENGCKQGKGTVEIRWQPGGTYKRCDAKDCDSYEPAVSYSGIWTNVALPVNGNLAKIATDGAYTEIATINETALIYHGQCKIVRAR